MIWWIVPVAVGFFGLVVTLTGLSRIGKRKMSSGTARVLGGGIVLSAAGLLAMMGMNLQTYSRLTLERTVAIVDLQRIEPQHFSAQVKLAQDDMPVTYDVRGDEISLQARVIKWSSWRNVIGYDSIYRLDRLSGQYASVEEELEAPRTVYSMHSDPGVDVFDMIRRRGGWLNAVDAYYGSGTYVPMVDGASYEIIMTQNGLITRALNEPASRGLRDWARPEGQSL
ncbi:hypothetical protein [Ponticaulis sp.]|uniref:hypothetical protein n=1 Tax=Ponticaulis sp. TaxID=2020902 RepID=UPI000B747F85|nr:hypothetical protein [Ponticaulis sp.]MAI90768.1 hypothetical protein [Ponticaulis sp.]OUX98993.1 MAG: hypothetical protein CBB65_10030 [Hyphomonadaceae bacterium TMED5]|tara:strand:+ start:51996 stop:52670 length:675 start_codon:yes stop_codon:yes gene_type:complete